jgi:hypothetical protein
VWTKFSKKKLWKKVKFPLSMNFGRINTSKCRGKLQKMGGALHPFSQKPWPITQTSKNSFFLNKKISKKCELSHRHRCQLAASNQRSPTSRGSTPAPVGQFPFFLNFFLFLPSTFCASGQLWLVGSSTCPPCPDFSLKLKHP